MTIRKIVLLFGMAWMLAACGGESASGSSESEADDTLQDTVGEDALEDTASEVVTTLADVNGFNIVTTTLNPRSYDIYGTEVEITAYVKDHSNNPVKDGTVVSFVADDNGLVEDQCATTGGTCTVTWTSSLDRAEPTDPDADGSIYGNDFKVTVMGRTIGEDSFIDKNANSQFDTDETFYTQSEAFLDANDDGDYDADTGFDEYFDYNKNGSFDADTSDGKFRGNSCSDSARAAGHCAQKLEVWDTVRMINSSGSDVFVTLRDCAGAVYIAKVDTINISTTSCYKVEFQDPNGNIPPAGTSITVEADVGDIKVSPDEIPNKFVEPGTGYIGDLSIKPDGGGAGTLSLEVESLSGLTRYYEWDITQ